MNEKQFENILAKYPELIEEGLSIAGRQVNLKGKFVDLVLKDRHGQRLIAEIKKGTIKREHIGQLMDYEGYYLSPEDPTIRVMLIGNRVPPNFRKALEHHGFEWREIGFNILNEFLKKNNDFECLAYLNELNDNTDNRDYKTGIINNMKSTSDILTGNYIKIEIKGSLVKKSTNTLFRQHKEVIDNEHLFFKFQRFNWMDENGISKRAVTVFSRKTCNLIIIPAILINKYFFHVFYELKDASGYSLKAQYTDYERNIKSVGLKFNITASNYLQVSAEAYRTSTSKDVKLFSLPQEYWDIFKPNPNNIENDIINEINKRLSKNEIEQGKGIVIPK
jgi:hypothetical protein